MKRRIALLLAFALVFTSTFGAGVSYAETEAKEDFYLNYLFCDDYEEYQGLYRYRVSAEDFAQAKTEDGVDIIVPEGYISGPGTDDYGFTINAYAYFNRTESDIASLDMTYTEEEEPDGDNDYEDVFYMKDKAEDGTFTHVITATMKNDEEVVYTFNFKEEGDDDLAISHLGITYYDDNGNDQYRSIISSSIYDDPTKLSDLAGGKSVEIPYYYDSNRGFSFEAASFGCLFKTDFAPKYTMTGNTGTFTLGFIAANGKRTTIPVTVNRDADGSRVALDSFEVNVWEYWDSDESYVSEWITFDDFTINEKNEIYLSIPSTYQCCYDADDSFCEWVDIESISDITLYAYTKDGARFKVVDSEGWTNMQDYTQVKMEGYEYQNCKEDSTVLQVYSANGKVVKTYTVKVIVSDCEGSHVFSTWQTEKAATCTEGGLDVHKCRDCSYKEYKATSPLGHKPGPSATCTTPQKCVNCAYQYAPAKGHAVVNTVVTPATTGNDGSVVKTCSCGAEVSRIAISKIAKVQLVKPSVEYNGKVQNGKVVVKDAAGNVVSASNYTVKAPAGRKAIGNYKYKITFKNNYKGTATAKLTITPAKIKLKAPKAAKKAITVKWKSGKKAQVTGYEVIAATNKALTKGKKKATVTGYKKTSKQIKGLKAKKTYYVSVRAYKTVKGVKIYSDWSAPKKIKTK